MTESTLLEIPAFEFVGHLSPSKMPADLVLHGKDIPITLILKEDPEMHGKLTLNFAPGQGSTPRKTLEKGRRPRCNICCLKPLEAALISCGHTFCRSCASKIMLSSSRGCYYCRKQSSSFMRIHL